MKKSFAKKFQLDACGSKSNLNKCNAMKETSILRPVSKPLDCKRKFII